MALDIVTQDIIIDETTGLQDNDVNSTVSPHDNATVTYLKGLDSAGGLASPEVAFKQNFVVASAGTGETITSVVLTQNSSGTPFSTTVGVNSGIQTVDGNYVWLFQDATHPKVVIGVIGTSDPAAEPAESGPLAFSFALINTSNTNADLYTVQYVPLLHPDATQPDDRIDLANKVFASVTASTVLNFSQLGDAPPGHNNWYILDADVASTSKILVTAHDNGVQSEVNVSTQGLGVASQDVRFGRELQIDLINGGTQSAGKNFTNAPIGPDYDSHVETVSSAGFSVSQSTPTNTKADIEVHAYNNNDNAEGAALPGDDNDTEINITGVTFKLNGVATTAAALGITIDLTGTGLILHNVGEGVTVDFTTAGGVGGTFDRFTIKNIDLDKDYFDVKEVHYGSDLASAHTEEVGSFINFDDDSPTISTTSTPPTITADETSLGTNPTGNFAPNFAGLYGADGAGTTTYALGVTAGVVAGLLDEETGETVSLAKVGSVIEARTTTGNFLVFTVSVDASGVVTFDQARSIKHGDATSPDDTLVLGANAADILTLTATITDKDGDHAAATLNIGDSLRINDDGPVINVPLDTDPATAGIQTVENLGNAVGQTATGNFGYNLGADDHLAAFYSAGGSDFIDSNAGLAGTQIALTGTVDNSQNPGITSAVATLTSESATSATFDWSFHYDKDPITAGVQDGTAGGTLTFNKAAGTYSLSITDAVDGFSFDVLHTSELLAKAPAGNTGHPEIVVEQLTPNGDPNPFFVQFTGNSNPNGKPFGFNGTGDGSPIAGDTAFDNGQFVTSDFEDWVSATQSTNGVAGDTIQKGELLTLRFFGADILGTVNPNAPGGGNEHPEIDNDPNTAGNQPAPRADASGIVLKFDGIGNSEDLLLVLDLYDDKGTASLADDVATTRSIFVQNGDMYKGNTVPAPYNSEFSLDNNDALVIIESNDYNAAGEHFQLRGVQIMQSGNGLTGTAIDLNKAIGPTGGSSTTTGLQAWEAADNDVLKIVDIGFIQQTSGTIDANLDFAFNVQDGDFDPTILQHLGVHISNDFI